MQVIAGGGVNQSAASLVAGGWAAAAYVVNTAQAVTRGMTRYQFTGIVPAAATQLAVLLSFTPSGTAGADNSISINGVQFEIGPSASPFEHLDAQVVLEICQRYAWALSGTGGGSRDRRRRQYRRRRAAHLHRHPRAALEGADRHRGARLSRPTRPSRDGDDNVAWRDAYAKRHFHQRQFCGNRRTGDAATRRRRLRMDPRQRGFLISIATPSHPCGPELTTESRCKGPIS